MNWAMMVTMLGYKQKRQAEGRRAVFATLSTRHLVRWLSGWLFLALGVVGLLLPILQGVLFILIGMILLAPYIPLFRKLRIKILLRFPRLRMMIVNRRHKRRRRRAASRNPEGGREL